MNRETNYTYILQLSQQMLILAKTEKWDELIELNKDYQSSVAKAMIKMKEDLLIPEYSVTIKALVQQLLAYEQDITALLQLRMYDLDKKISIIDHNQQAYSAYYQQLQHQFA